MKKTAKLLFTALLLFGASTLYAQGSYTNEALRKKYDEASDLFRKEKYASAQHIFDQVAASASESDETLAMEAAYYAAICSEQLGNLDAEYRIDEFLRLYPQSSHGNMAKFYRGNYYYSISDYRRALDWYRQVDASDIEFGHRDEYDFKKGYCYFQNKDSENAKSLMAKVMSGKSKYRNSAIYYYGHIQYAEGEYELALKSFKRIEGDRKFAKILPSYVARIYYYLGREDELLALAPKIQAQDNVFKKDELNQMIAEVYFKRGEYANALAFYNKMDEPEPGQQDNYYQRGYCHYQLRNYDSAAYFLTLKTNTPDSIAQNALYTLGDTYLKLNRKDDARSMFLQASKLNFDKRITEDALFNYAKLSCELNKNPYNESIHSFENYLQTYPKTPHKREIQEILTQLYMTTRNYKDALTLIENIENKSATMNQAYQRIVINRGIELFNERNYKEASSYFAKAIKINAQPKSTADALYLHGETRFRLDDYAGAQTSLSKFFNNSNASASPYYKQALYSVGYSSLKSQQYRTAIAYFARFLRQTNRKDDVQQICDAHDRMGDCYYVLKSFDTAIIHYNVVIDNRGKDADYALYQKALCYGAMGKNEEKLNSLNAILEKYPSSNLAGKALYEVANTYLVCDNNEMALLYFNNFIEKYPQSAYVKEALLNIGLIYYNTERDSLALVYLDRLLNNYQGTDEARDALATVKNIYISQNRVDQYFDYVNKTTSATVSTGEQDSTIYLAAENRYYDGDCDNAIKNYELYLKKFPNGLFHINAHYCLADCLSKMGQQEKALPHYEFLASRGKNKYTEKSILNAANINYSLGDNHRALELYQQLLRVSENTTSRLQAQSNIMRCYVQLDDHRNTIAAADAIIKDPKAPIELVEEAHVTKARSYFKEATDKLNDQVQRNEMADSTNASYDRIANSSNGDYTGEGAYRKAELLFINNALDSAERVIDNYSTNAASDYWLAKSFILWADIFYARGNKLQAQQTLQSIIDNYDGEDLVSQALERRNRILTEQANENKKQDSDDSDEVIININDPE
ncbi:MAG: tetratricopeptide repeat protein [Bacteroidales bacterium]|nr:tetratricopeptide repeat protein [Bacteroidales bacterium]